MTLNPVPNDGFFAHPVKMFSAEPVFHFDRRLADYM
jgi:hypothetical protein